MNVVTLRYARCEIALCTLRGCAMHVATVLNGNYVHLHPLPTQDTYHIQDIIANAVIHLFVYFLSPSCFSLFLIPCTSNHNSSAR